MAGEDRRPASRPRRWRPRPRAAAAGAVAAGGLLLAGCASAAAPAPAPTPAPARPAAVTAPLATSLAGAGGRTWAIVVMGGSAADENNFWELFTRPAGSAQWTLVTPPGVADNGGLVAAVPAAGQGLDVAFRPSQGLTFSPLALTGDGGRTWGAGLLDASVAAVPDALALGGGKMLALLGDGAIEQAATSGAAWRRLAAPGAVAASAAGRACEVTGLTAVSLTASGTPLVAASCARPGVAGIFVPAGASWQATGPSAGGRLAGQRVQVIRLTQYAAAGKAAGNAAANTATNTAGNMALLRAGTGKAASLLAAWTTDGTHWTVSPALPAGGTVLASGAGPGTSAWVLLAGGRAETVAGPGAAWRALPTPPRGTTVLAAGQAGTLDALAASGSTLTVFQLTAAGTWRQTQAISVPVQLGSSS